MASIGIATMHSHALRTSVALACAEISRVCSSGLLTVLYDGEKRALQ